MSEATTQKGTESNRSATGSQIVTDDRIAEAKLIAKLHASYLPKWGLTTDPEATLFYLQVLNAMHSDPADVPKRSLGESPQAFYRRLQQWVVKQGGPEE